MNSSDLMCLIELKLIWLVCVGLAVLAGELKHSWCEREKLFVNPANSESLRSNPNSQLSVQNVQLPASHL